MALAVAVGSCAAAWSCGGSSHSSAAPPGADASGASDATADAGPVNDGATSDGASDAGPVCTQSFPSAGSAGATITIDPSTTLNTFTPQTIFGTNNGYWLVPGDVIATQPKVQAAGNFSIRYPGGSSSDDYHWNGTGAYDASQHWIPSDSTYSPGFAGDETYRGTTSVSYGTPAKVTDGDETTAWLSNTDTDLPGAQWLYVDLGSTQTATSVDVVWGTPYAASFEVQSWTGASYPPPYQATSDGWLDVGTAAIAGTGGTQTVTFAPVQTEFLRLLLTASSDGPGGAYSIAELHAFDGTTALTTNAPTMSQSPTTASSTDPANAAQTYSTFDFESFMKYVALFSPAATPIITVNVGTGTPQEAAAWVRYANVVRGYGIRYWQIGNEMEGNWETGGPLNAEDYVRRYSEYYTAMKAADPSITILGPVSGGMNEPSNVDDGKTFIQDFITLLDGRGLGAQVDALDFHWYPTFDTVSWATDVASVAQIGPFATSLRATLATTHVNPDVPVFMTEYNIGIGSPNTPVSSVQLVGGLWTANALGEFIRYFGAGGGTNMWNTISAGASADTNDPTAGDLGYLQYDLNAYRYQERASYWATQMMATDWAIGGDTRTHRLVSATSNQADLAVYADERPDGVLALAVINRSQTVAHDVSIVLPDAPPAAANVWTFDSTDYAWETTATPYHAAPDLGPDHEVYCGASASTPFVFGPASVTVIRFDDAVGGGPTRGAPGDGGSAASTDAGTVTVLVDDMSDPAGAQIRLTPQRAGDVAGSWYTYIGGGADGADLGSITLPDATLPDGGSAPFTFTAIGASGDSGIAGPPGVDEAHAACIAGATPAAQYAFAAEGFDFEVGADDAGAYSAQYTDISAFTGIEFWVYNALSTPSIVEVQIPDKESIPTGGVCGLAADAALDQCYSPVLTDLTVAPGWSFQQVPFVSLTTNPYYGYQQPPGGDMTLATDVHFQINQPAAGGGAVAFDFCVGKIELYR